LRRVKRPSLSLAITLGLLAGLGVGTLASTTRAGWLVAFATGIEPVGTIWINLIRMVVIPLVVTALVSGVASLGDPASLGRVGAKTFGFFFGSIIIFSVLGLLLALVVIPLAPVAPEAAAQLRAAASERAADVAAQTQRIQGFRQFVLDLVPTNPVKAAADGSLLPLIVFSVLMGAATGSLAPASRKAIVDLCDAGVAALTKLIVWVMLVAPIGVFCLAAPVAAQFGWTMLRSLAVFVICVVAGIVVFGPLVYGAAATLLARVPSLPQFARDITPGATVAFTTTSSMAAVPTMMETAIDVLKLPRGVASFVIPLGATLNRPGSAIYQSTAVVFVAALYGITLTPALLGMAVLTCFLMTFSVASIPSATVFTTAPVLLAVGLPAEAIALLIGVDRIPDMFRTGLNGVGHQTAAAVVARGEPAT
jgi:Na+/H+-dicarboxylate symporter